MIQTLLVLTPASALPRVPPGRGSPIAAPAVEHDDARVVAASPAAAGGCLPSAGRILQDICEPGLGPYAADVLQFENEVIATWLAVHELAPTEAAALYQHARSDLRSEIRSAMLVRLSEIAKTPAGDRTTHEAAVYAWFQARFWELEKAFWDEAIALRNDFLGDACGWTPDPEVAAQYNIVYDSSWCDSTLLSLFAAPAVPVKGYFMTAALDNTYGQLLTGDPAGSVVFAETSINLVPAAVVAGLASALGIGAVATIAGVLAASLFPATVIGSAALASIAAAGVFAPLAIAAAIGIAAGVQAVENQKNQDDLAAMTAERTKAYAAPPDLASFIPDAMGSYKLTALLTDRSLPEFASASQLPAHTAGDLHFRITPNGGAVADADQFTWLDWESKPWSGYASGGWLVATRTDTNEQRFGVTFRFVDWNGAKYFASRLGRRFLVTKEKAASSDPKCEADTLTGVSPHTDLGPCAYYTTLGLRLKDASGQNVTVAFPGQPAFSSPNRTAFRFGLGEEREFVITATGGPLPIITLAPGSSVPSGTTLLDSNALAEAGKAKLVYPASGGAALGSYSLTVRATNAAGFVDQTIAIDVADQLAITSPNTLALQLGVPFSFHVQAVGLGQLVLERDGLWGPAPQPTFVDNGNGTATLSGTPTLPQLINCLNFGPAPDFDLVPCGFVVTEVSSGDRVFQEFTYTLGPAPAPSFTSPLVIEMDRGAPNHVRVTASNDFTGVRITQPCFDRPPWLSFVRDGEQGDVFIVGGGNGNAFLFGTPPDGDTVEEFELYLHAKPAVLFTSDNDLAECSSGTFEAHTVRLVPRPRFLDAPALTIVTGDSHTFEAVPTALPITVDGVLPPNVTLNDRVLGGPATVGAGGIYNLVLSMENSFGRAELPLELTVLEPPSLSSGDTAFLVAGQPAQLVLTAHGFPRSTLTFTPLAPLPDGLDFEQQLDIGVIEGVPTTPGVYPIPLRLKNRDEAGFTTETTLTIHVAAAVAGLTLAKSADSPTYGGAGDTATYTYTITNSGNVPIAGPFSVSDDKVAVDCSGAAPALAPTTSTSCSAVHTITVADVLAESITNTATATGSYGGNGVSSNQAQATVVGKDSDDDGVPDAKEATGPNGGDGNGDGVPDSEQPGVTTLVEADGIGNITIIADCPLRDVAAISELTLPRGGRILLFGLVEFRALCSDVNLQFLYHDASSWRKNVHYRKYGPTTPGDPTTTGWYTLPGVVFDVPTIAGRKVARAAFSLHDGELGDDTAVDGVIVDQGGPSIPTEAVPVSGRALLFVAILLALAGAWVLRRP